MKELQEKELLNALSTDKIVKVEDLASKVLQSPKYSDKTKSLAGSVLSQSNKER